MVARKPQVRQSLTSNVNLRAAQYIRQGEMKHIDLLLGQFDTPILFS